MKKTIKFLLSCLLTLIFFTSLFAAETENITITTYYPSPYGSYREMRTQRLTVGEDYMSNDYSWNIGAVYYIPNEASMIVRKRVGINKYNPEQELHIRGYGIGAKPSEDADIILEGVGDIPVKWSLVSVASDGNFEIRGTGTGYNAVPVRIEKGAPDDSLKVESNGYVGIALNGSNVGIGTSNPEASLDVIGSAILVPRRSSDPGSARNGMIYYNTSLKTFRCRKDGSWVNCLGSSACNWYPLTLRDCESMGGGGRKCNAWDYLDDLMDNGYTGACRWFDRTRGGVWVAGNLMNKGAYADPTPNTTVVYCRVPDVEGTITNKDVIESGGAWYYGCR